MNERDIFLEALEKGSADERRSFLDHACGDDAELRGQIELLLESHEDADSLLDHPILGGAETETLGEVTKESKPAGFADDNAFLDFLQPTEDGDCLGKLGPYRVVEAISRGGMGVVLRAHDPKLNRVVAIKVLAPELAANATARKRFLREARAAAAVSHDHVVTIYAVEENEPSKDSPQAGRRRLPYLVMEFIDGPTLQEKIDREGNLELKEILRIGRQIAAGLSAAHEQGLIHRDVKPGNILLQNGVERVQITDFGLARAADDVGITRTGEVAGTPQYMSPEQAQGEPVDVRSDLFSLGSVLYAMCTGRSPFRAETTVASLRRVCDDSPRPIREINPDYPDWLVAIVDRLLEKDPDDRFQAADEVSDLLSRHLAHLQNPQLAALPDPVKPAKSRLTRRDVRRHRWVVAATVLLCVVGLATITEATGVTNFAATVIRVATGEGTLVIEVDDPSVEVSLDGEELSIKGAGIQELKLRPGQYQFRAAKDGQPIKQELVVVTRGGRQVVKVEAVVEFDAETKGKRPPPPAVAPFLPEEARRHQERWAEYLGVPVEIENCIGMKMVLIPPGEYGMSMLPIPSLPDDDGPPMVCATGTDTQRVAVKKPLWIGKCEVDVAQFRRFVESTGYVTLAEKTAKGGGVMACLVQDRDSSLGPLRWSDPGFPQDENHPVVHVCWSDAIAFCRWLGEKDGRTYRLPRNAEWEYACRAGRNTRFYTGEAESSLQGAANVLDKSAQSIAAYHRVGPRFPVIFDDRHPFTSPVASFEPNAFGLYDMHGNVWEWCEEVLDRVSPDRPDRVLRIARGGAHDALPLEAGSNFAFWFDTKLPAWTIGFRVVATTVDVASQLPETADEGEQSQPQAELEAQPANE